VREEETHWSAPACRGVAERRRSLRRQRVRDVHVRDRSAPSSSMVWPNALFLLSRRRPAGLQRITEARGVQHFGGALPEHALGDFVLVVSVLMPVLSVCLFLMAERRALSTRGIVRFYIAFCAVGILYWLPGLSSFHSWVLSLPRWMVERSCGPSWMVHGDMPSLMS
jgi:hypothetical protein